MTENAPRSRRLHQVARLRAGDRLADGPSDVADAECVKVRGVGGERDRMILGMSDAELLSAWAMGFAIPVRTPLRGIARRQREVVAETGRMMTR